MDFNEESKACTLCLEMKPISQFSFDSSKKNYRKSACKSCTSVKSLQYRQNNPEYYRSKERKDYTKKWHRDNKDRVRNQQYMKRYGIGLDEYNAIKDRQGGRCAICGTEPTNQNLNVDHCHATGNVRGLLCLDCNHILGKAHDDPSLLIKAAEYLQSDKADSLALL